MLAFDCRSSPLCTTTTIKGDEKRERRVLNLTTRDSYTYRERKNERNGEKTRFELVTVTPRISEEKRTTRRTIVVEREREMDNAAFASTKRVQRAACLSCFVFSGKTMSTKKVRRRRDDVFLSSTKIKHFYHIKSRRLDDVLFLSFQSFAKCSTRSSTY